MSQTETATRTYRATFIIDTREQSDDVEALTARLQEALSAVGCQVTDTENLGQIEFSRVTDRHRPSGIYLKFILEAAPEAPAAIQEKFRLDRTVDRIMIQSL
jgi:small subunit ribosomal protein S6